MKSLTKKLPSARLNKILTITTICISIILLMAAYGKWFYPAELLKGWDRGISIFEFLFVGLLLYARKVFKIWVLAACIFASWGGYAAYWYQVDLPCSCMGERLHIPTLLSLVLDAVFFLVALSCIHLLGGRQKGLSWGIALGVLGGGVGFWVASTIYHVVLVSG